jgi:nucleoside-diphosphate-sugar epimerase
MTSSIKTTKFFLSGATGASSITPASTGFVFIFFTGYIGGAVLARFLQHPNAASFEFTLLVRNPEKAEGFRRMGLNTVVGSLADEALLERLASEADVVIATVRNYALHWKSVFEKNHTVGRL